MKKYITLIIAALLGLSIAAAPIGIPASESDTFGNIRFNEKVYSRNDPLEAEAIKSNSSKISINEINIQSNSNNIIKLNNEFISATNSLNNSLKSYATTNSLNSVSNSLIAAIQGNTAILTNNASRINSITNALTNLNIIITSNYTSATNLTASAPQTIYQKITVLTNGTITLAPNCSIYQLSLATNTACSFILPANMPVSSAVTFELNAKFSSKTWALTFPAKTIWITDKPDFNLTNTTYILRFRSYDSGTNWIANKIGTF